MNEYEDMEKMCPNCGKLKKTSNFHATLAGVRVCSACYKRWRKIIKEFDIEDFIEWLEKWVDVEMEVEVHPKRNRDC